MIRNQQLILIGAPMEGQKIVGPFSCFDEADEWCRANLDGDQFTWIVPLYSPESYKESA